MSEPLPPPPALPEATLQLMAEAISGDPFYFGCTLDLYQRRRHLSDDQLAAELRCGRSALYNAFLCRQPDLSTEQSVTRDINSIAEVTGIAADRLANIARKAQQAARLVQTVQTQFTTQRTYRAAAQDREPGSGAGGEQTDEDDREDAP